MSLLDQASLVLVPSAIKTGEVLVQKPLPTKFSDETGNYDGNDPQGSANLTFTRNSNASRVNSSGLVEKVRTNLILQSNTFSTTWVTSNTTITGGQAGYDGTSNAWLLDKISSNGYIGQSVSYTGSYTQSIYVKAGTSNWLAIQNAGLASSLAYFDLQNGVIGTAQANVLDHTITSVGSGWYRCSVVYNGASGTARFFVADSDGVISGTSGNILIQSAQYETGDIATAYIPTTTSARSTFAGITVDGTSVPNVPRLDYSGGATCGRLILEPQRTNVCLWSESIDNAGWIKINAPTITTNIATAPDGYGGADGIQDTTGSNFKRIRQLISVSANSTNTASVFVKKETSQTNFGGLSMGYTGGSARYAYGIINPITGTIVVSTDSLISSSSTKVEDYGDWWRFSLTTTDDGGNTTIEIAYYSTLSNNGTTAGVGAGSVRTIWGLQLELGASYATSYIGPTLGASVTRLADDSYLLQTPTDADTFTYFFEVEAPDFASGGGELLLENAGSSSQVRVYLNNSSTGLLRLRTDNPANNYDHTYASLGIAVGDTLKIALSINNGVMKGFINGVLETTAVAATISFGRIHYRPVTDIVLKQALYFDSALSDSDCENLTAL